MKQSAVKEQPLAGSRPETRDAGENMEQFLYESILFDLYGALLTDKQQECLRMQLFEDLSMSEIGDALGISRQAVYDNIHRGEKAMEAYERKLGLAARYRREQASLQEVSKLVSSLETAENQQTARKIQTLLAPWTKLEVNP